MTESSKPREWWIIYEKGYSTWVSDKALDSADTTDEIHVIEKSAHDQALERIKVLEEVIAISDSILLLTHPDLSNVEMNTLTTRQYILWKEAKAKLSSEESEK